MKGIKKGSAWLLATALVLTTVAISKVNAAIGVDTNKPCSITFEIGGDTGEGGEFAELGKLSIPVELYQVADITSTGSFTATEGFESLDLDKVDSNTTAAQWEEKTAQAVELIESSSKTPDTTTQVTANHNKVEQLHAGMYLIVAKDTLSNLYSYKFAPALISLPNNLYATGEGEEDGWVYDATATLKPEKEALFGSVEIKKTVSSFNKTLGDATFVFGIEATKDGEKVYSDVATVVFDSAGTKSVIVDKIPAGSTVTITEIYSGSSYDLVGEGSKTVEIVADTKDEAGNPVIHTEPVSFTNAYNGKLNGNASVVNHFEKTETGWEWSKK